MPLRELAKKNFTDLGNNPYPGRGIVLGVSPDGSHLVQVYWIMGRSENSRNRVFLQDDQGHVRTKAWDESKLEDPSLIIYYPARALHRCHIVTNGDQTDTIFNYMQEGKDFHSALLTREYEPDAPNFTPRISGIMDGQDARNLYVLSILKTFANSDESGCQRQFFHYQKELPGLGHCITTYQGDGAPLPSFHGEPVLMPIMSDAKQCAHKYWEQLNEDNRVSLLVKFINRDTYEAETVIINRHS